MNEEKKRADACVFSDAMGLKCLSNAPNKCEKCGWNPEVAKRRVEQRREAWRQGR